jgi:valyl-tRNA synthetase
MRARSIRAAQEIDWLIRLVSEIRAARTELNVPPGATLYRSVSVEFFRTIERLARNSGESPARAGRYARAYRYRQSGGYLQSSSTGRIPRSSLGDVVDIDAESAASPRRIAAAEKERDGLAGA